jgi:hypothetical protein
VLPFITLADYNAANLALDGDKLDRQFVRPPAQLELFGVEPSVLDGQL